MKRLLWLPALAMLACDATDVGETPIDPGPDMRPGDMTLPDPGVDQDVPECLGQLGSACGADGACCVNGLCVASPDGGGVCTINCVVGEANGCPDGWFCENSVELGGEVCQPGSRLELCAPCTEDWQCGGTLDLCLPVLSPAGTKACAIDCTATPCPAGFSCEMLGDGAQQCVPADGVCPDEVPDGDGDGVPDGADRCPDEEGVPPHGCPDGDGDGVPDGEDACPDVAGELPDGCPPPGDVDGDGVPDEEDACVNDAGALPNGCPVGTMNGQFISGGGLIEAFGRGIQGLLGAQPSNASMSSPGYRIQPISFGVNP